VAGLAACVLQARPTWTPQQVIRALRETASRATQPDFRVGYGIPNGFAALQWPNSNVLDGEGRVVIALRGANPTTTAAGAVVDFALGRDSTEPEPAHLRVHDIGGRVVRTLWSGTLVPGESRRAVWDGRDDDARAVHSGIFWIAVDVRGTVASARVVVVN
jgi:hypothetical protein